MKSSIWAVMATLGICHGFALSFTYAQSIEVAMKVKRHSTKQENIISKMYSSHCSGFQMIRVSWLALLSVATVLVA